jgi:hypothetical protein
MTDKKPDPTSDAARSDPKVADENRENLEKQAEQQLRKATDRSVSKKTAE